MKTPIGALLRAGFAFKATQLRQAASHYVEDRTDHAKSLATGYAVAAGLFAVAGVFLTGACAIGMIALYLWLEPQYGVFASLGICAGILLVLMVICLIAAMVRMNSRPPAFPSLGNRLGSAVKGNPFAPAIQATKAKTSKTVAGGAGPPAAAPTRYCRHAPQVSRGRDRDCRDIAYFRAGTPCQRGTRRPARAAPCAADRAGRAARAVMGARQEQRLPPHRPRGRRRLARLGAGATTPQRVRAGNT